MRIDRVQDDLLGANGRPRARGKRREALLDKLRALTEGIPVGPETSNLLNEALVRDRRAKRQPHRSNQTSSLTSTAAGLEGGVKAFPHYSPEQLRLIAEGITYDPAHALAFRPPDADSPIVRVEDRPVLDIRALSRVWDLDSSSTYGAFLVWPYGPMDGASRYLLTADLRDPDMPLLTVTRFDLRGVKAKTQFIDLAVSKPPAPRRWHMVCPVTGKWCDLLILRGGVFASPKAQRAVHSSQRATQGRSIL